MTGWIEVRLTLRGFAADPREVAEFLGDPSCEIARAGQRINNVSQAKYRENAVWTGLETSDPRNVQDSITKIMNKWGGIDRVEQALKINSIKFTDFDIAIFDHNTEYSDLNAIFLDELIVRDIARLNGSVGVSSHPIVEKRHRLPRDL
jgi:hypothetical protein